MIKANSYFCGAGLLDVGLIEAGIEINQAFEIDSDACATYRHNIGNHIKECDLSKELIKSQLDCDVMVFTYPCTKYSRIADIHQTRTGDELFLHALRHLAVAGPEAFVVENVPGMKAFPVVMEAMTELADYYTTIFCPVKSEIWLPQRRDRLIIIGTRKPFAFRPPEHSRPIKLSEILEEHPRITIPEAVKARMSGKYRDLPIISDPERNDIAPTCVAHYAKDKSTRLVCDNRYDMGVRPYSVREYARLQGLPDCFEFPVSDTAAYKQIGNGVPRHFGHWIGAELTRYFYKNSSYVKPNLRAFTPTCRPSQGILF